MTSSTFPADTSATPSRAPHQPHPASQRAIHLWTKGDGTGDAFGHPSNPTDVPLITDGDPPVAGDLWVTSPDPERPELDALVLVTRVFADGHFVLAVPVTPTSFDPARAATSVALPQTRLDQDLLAWPALETGIAYKTLARRIDNAVDAAALARLRAYGDARRPNLSRPHDDPQHPAQGRLEELVDLMAHTCYTAA